MAVAKLVLTLLSFLIGFFFIFVGIMKLTPVANEEVHEQMKQNFHEAAKVFPFQKYTGFKPKPDLFRTVIGAIEVVCGAILLLIPGIAFVFLMFFCEC